MRCRMRCRAWGARLGRGGYGGRREGPRGLRRRARPAAAGEPAGARGRCDRVAGRSASPVPLRRRPVGIMADGRCRGGCVVPGPLLPPVEGHRTSATAGPGCGRSRQRAGMRPVAATPRRDPEGRWQGAGGGGTRPAGPEERRSRTPEVGSGVPEPFRPDLDGRSGSAGTWGALPFAEALRFRVNSPPSPMGTGSCRRWSRFRGERTAAVRGDGFSGGSVRRRRASRGTAANQGVPEAEIA
jgi:hypothetical protein